MSLLYQCVFTYTDVRACHSCISVCLLTLMFLTFSRIFLCLIESVLFSGFRRQLRSINETKFVYSNSVSLTLHLSEVLMQNVDDVNL